jgi:hypothetical protein|nr:MAG TPA: hypothetical protein [Caudoviricetes sp.]
MNKKFEWLDYINFCREKHLKPLLASSLDIYFAKHRGKHES